MKYLILLLILFSNLLAEYNATKNAQDLGLYYQDYNQNMALVGILIGFIFMFFTIYVFVDIAKGK
jgi:hypothetical protein